VNKLEITNPIREQCFSLPELAEGQVQSVLSALENLISVDNMKGINKIILTGCGDSYFAGIATQEIFKEFSGTFTTSVHRAIDVSRFLDEKTLTKDTLVIVVSASGGAARLVEAVKNANAFGSETLMITNNNTSPAAKLSKYVLVVDTPAVPYATLGLRNYYASLIGLTFTAMKIGIAKGKISENILMDTAEALVKYTLSYENRFEEIDDKMYNLAREWNNLKSYDYIGDGKDRASALFSAAKIVEACGKFTTHDDSEDWCHVNHFLTDSERVGTIIYVDKNEANESRVLETIKQAQGIFRPILIITNNAELKINEGVNICKLPETPKGYEFLYPMLNYIPAAILAGYIAELNKEPYFRGEGSVWDSPGVQTIKTSKIQ